MSIKVPWAKSTAAHRRARSAVLEPFKHTFSQLMSKKVGQVHSCTQPGQVRHIEGQQTLAMAVNIK